LEKALFTIADAIPNMAQQADFDFAGVAISNIYGNTGLLSFCKRSSKHCANVIA